MPWCRDANMTEPGYLKLPVVPTTVQYPESFLDLHNFMYTTGKHADHFLSALLPHLPVKPLSTAQSSATLTVIPS